MKIIKPPDNEDPRVIEKELATAGCDICPCCKKKNTASSFSSLNIKEHKYWIEKYYTQNYKCVHCGCEYTSDPYWHSTLPQDNFDSTIAFIFGLLGTVFSGIFVFVGRSLITTIPLMIISIIFCIGGAYKLYKCLNEYKKHL